jgi:hypothetical protein
VEGAVRKLQRSVQIAAGLILLHFAAAAYSWIARPEYDGGDFSALIFLVYLSHILLIAGGLILLFHLVRWFVTRKADGL